ncbi:MAG: hypothetical protein QOG15_3186 [Solirubrobacteraceae bacterium]|nr:hypothetical protein [Solirubrobacteraceae bacterium]
MSAVASPRARRVADHFPRSAFRLSGAALLLTAVSGPFWSVIAVGLPGASLTVGRGLIVVAALLLAIDARRAPRPLPRPGPALWLLLAALALLWTWTVINAATWGCQCSADVAGFSELVAVVTLVALLATFEPRLRPVLVLAVIGGAALAALLALAGVDGFSVGTRNPSPDVARLAGPYGNPNNLAFAIGFSVPVGVVLWGVCPARRRPVLAVVLAVICAALVLTYSRGGLLATAAGVVVVLVFGRPRGRARWRAVAGVLAAAVTLALAYPLFAELRLQANAPKGAVDAATPDRSGWDARTQGLIPGSPATMRNPLPGVLEVRADGPGRGISHALRTARRDRAYEVRFEARAVGAGTPLRFGLEDNLLGNGPVQRMATIGGAWQALRMRWTPPADSPSARFYVWTPVAGDGFQIRHVVAVARAPGALGRPRAISTTLEGSVAQSPQVARHRQEAREIESRRVGADLALRAFASQPVRGIGWGRFTAYSTAHSQFRALPTHDDYLRVLAELGVVGGLLLVVTGIAIGWSFWRRPLDELGLALLGILVTGAAGLIFVDGLVATAISLPLAYAAAIACARAAPQRAAAPAEVSPWWPPRGQPRIALDWRMPALMARLRSVAARLRAAPALLARVRAAGPDPARVRVDVGQPLQRLRAAAPRPAPRPAPDVLGAPASALATGLERLRGAAPQIAPAGRATSLREVEPSGRWTARRGSLADLAGRIAAARVGARVVWAAGVGVAALAVRVPLMFERHEIGPGGDSADYVHLAQTFFDQGHASVVRPPGYPLFLAIAGVLPGRLEDAAVVIQLLIGAGLCAAVVFVAWPYFGRLAAVLAGLLVALTAPFLSTEALLLADALFGVFVTAVAALIAAAALDEQRRTRWLFATGFVIAGAVYVKPVGDALVLAPLLPLALATRSWRATLVGSGVVLGVVALLTVPWMLRNDAHDGGFTMSAQTGATLFNRAFERDGLEIPTDLPTGRLAADFQRAHPGRRLSSGITAELTAQGDTPAEVQRKMRAVALEAVGRHPLEFVSGTLRSTHDVFGDVAAGRGEDALTASVTHGAPLPIVTRIGLAAGWPLRAIWLVLALSGLSAALWLTSRSRATRIAAAAAIGVWATVAVATAVLHGGHVRYSASLAPLTFLLAGAGVTVAVKVTLALLESSRGPRPSLVALVRDAATPSALTDLRVGSSAR